MLKNSQIRMSQKTNLIPLNQRKPHCYVANKKEHYIIFNYYAAFLKFGGTI